jgi:periplasmic divalent cation tolerance protein
MATDKIVVLVTCGSAAESRRIARKLVEGKRAACVNILSAPVESIYRWRGKVESAREFLLVIKTKKKEFAGLQRAILELHSYDVPEILALPIAAGSPDYLQWMEESVGLSRSRPEQRRRRARKVVADVKLRYKGLV